MVRVSVMQHPDSKNDYLGIVTSRGRKYLCTWTGPVTTEEVLSAWKTARKDFRPYVGCW